MKNNTNNIFELFLRHKKICTDTRCVEDNSIFFALKGDNFNGNKYAETAIKSGCCYAVVDEKEFCTLPNILFVDNVVNTLQQLATEYRKHLNHKVIAITGTNGKTTTKELINAVLSEKYKVHATKGNLNNHLGVPLTILSTPADTEIGIVEMGANHPGEIAQLCQIAKADYGLITNIGKAHLEGFGSFEGVINTKKEMYDYALRAGKKIFINNKNPLLEKISAEFVAENKISYHTTCHKFVSIDSDTAKLFWKHGQKQTTITSNLFGAYNYENIVAAITVGHTFGVDSQFIKHAIEQYLPGNNRSQIKQTPYNTLILDAYNANPTSMNAAISSICTTYTADNIVLILGDMLELGKDSINEHLKIIKIIEEKGIKQVLLVGSVFSQVNTNNYFETFQNADEVVNLLKIRSIKKKKILIKGSRGIKLEKIVSSL